MKKKYTLVISDVEMNVVTDAPWESVEKIVGILDRKMRDIHLKSYRCTKNQAALLCALEYCSEKLELQERNAELEEIAEQDAATIAQKEQRIAELEEELSKLQGENEIMHNILERAAASTKRMMGHHEPAAKEEPVAEPVAEAAAEPVAEAVAEPMAEPEQPVVEEIAPVQEAPEQLTVDFTVAEPVAEPEVAEIALAEEAVEAEAAPATEEIAEVEPEQVPEVNTKAAQVLEEIADSQSDVPRVKAKAKQPKSRSRVGSMFDLLTFNDV